MAQLSFVNRHTYTLKVGDYVKLHPSFKDSVVFTYYYDRDLIGTVASQAAPGRRCVINLLNTVTWADVHEVPDYQPLHDNLTRLSDYNRVGGDAKYAEYDSNGLLVFVGAGSGVPYGEYHGENIAGVVDVLVADDHYEVTVAGLAGGLLNQMAFTTHYLTVGKAGTYIVNWSMTIDTSTASDELEGGVMVDAVAITGKGTSHTTVAAGSLGSAIAGSLLLGLTAGQKISLYVSNHSSNRDIVIGHLTCTAFMIGGI